MSQWPDQEWLDQLNTALADAGVAGGPLTVAQRITDGDSYHITVDDDGAAASAGLPTKADLTFTQTAETAMQLRSGELGAGAAILLGQVTLSGDPTKAIEHKELLQQIANATEAID